MFEVREVTQHDVDISQLGRDLEGRPGYRNLPLTLASASDYPDASMTAMSDITISVGLQTVAPSWQQVDSVTDCGQHAVPINSSLVQLWYVPRFALSACSWPRAGKDGNALARDGPGDA